MRRENTRTKGLLGCALTEEQPDTKANKLMCTLCAIKKNEENYCGFFAPQNPGRFSIRAQ